MTLIKQRARTVNIQEAYERALWEPLDLDEIREMSVSTRCALIRKVLDAQNDNVKRETVYGMSLTSLERLGKSFEISEGFHEWQRNKRRVLVNALTRPENTDILDVYKNWDNSSVVEQQAVLKKSALLHAKVYAQGICELLPYQHVFKEGAIRQTLNGIGIVFGGFNGDITTGKSEIVQYTDYGRMLESPFEAFVTAHHETTHLIQHHLAFSINRNSISRAHPLYNEALYFREIDRHKAVIPSANFSAYSAQPYEVLAEWEGAKIASSIQSLAL